MKRIADNLKKTRQRLTEAASASQRNPSDVQLLAVSKMQEATSIEQAYDCGQRDFGENYLQEALEKMAALSHLPLSWHFIGPIQSNKTKAIAEHFSWVHTLERSKIAQRLSAQRPAQLPLLNVCIQVNICEEASKSGCMPAEVFDLADEIATLPNLKLRGLMAIPKATQDPGEQRHNFAELQSLLQALKQNHPTLDTLSMGMSADLEAAVEKGATIVRVGTGIFGARPLKH